MFDSVRELYSEEIRRHGRRPEHAGRPEGFDASAKGDNPMCGDRIQVWVKYGTGESIAETGFQARGCAISVASADLIVAVEAALDHRSRAPEDTDFSALTPTPISIPLVGATT